MNIKCILKFVGLLAVGLITAIFIYPFLHEFGHSLAALICGAEVLDVTMFPLPSVLCKIEYQKELNVITIGFGGILFPYLLTNVPPPKKFWIWYIWILIKGITLLSLLLSMFAVYMFGIGKPVVNEDVTQILKYTAKHSAVYIVIFMGMGTSILYRIIKSKPLLRCKREFDF